jgi:hypothetical protein
MGVALASLRHESQTLSQAADRLRSVRVENHGTPEAVDALARFNGQVERANLSFAPKAAVDLASDDEAEPDSPA